MQGTLLNLTGFYQDVNTVVDPVLDPNGIEDGVLIHSNADEASWDSAGLPVLLNTNMAAQLGSELEIVYTQYQPIDEFDFFTDQLPIPVLATSLGIAQLIVAAGGIEEPTVYLNYAVPLPGAVWLMGSALVGLIGWRNRANEAK